MRIGIIGSGEMGGKIGRLLADAGHEIMFSSRHPEKLQGLALAVGKNAHTGTAEEAASFGDVVFMAVPFRTLEDVTLDISPVTRGKIVVDITNPVSWDEKSEKLVRHLPLGKTAAAEVARLLPEA